jgi:hypothetical protein
MPYHPQYNHSEQPIAPGGGHWLVEDLLYRCWVVPVIVEDAWRLCLVLSQCNRLSGLSQLMGLELRWAEQELKVPVTIAVPLISCSRGAK